MSAGDTTAYEPKYTSLENVPLGSFDYPDDEKRQAIARAESRLEADVNDGEEIQSPEGIHADAVENLATFRLLRPATGPTEARYGETAEYGENQLDYLQTYKQEYEEIVEAINAAEGDEGEGSGESTDWWFVSR